VPKFSSLEDFYSSLPEDQRTHITSLVKFVSDNYPKLELVLAWNQPMFKSGKHYVVGFMPTKKHTNILTVTDTAVTELIPQLGGYKHGSRSISLPFGWTIEPKLIRSVLECRQRELGLHFT